MDCPKCVGRLQKKEIVETKVSDVEELSGVASRYELHIHQCFSCGGTWFDHGELDKYLGEGMALINSPSLGKDTNSELNHKEGKCPQCKVLMRKVPSAYSETVIIDACSQCKGIWLDATEIDRLERMTRKRPTFFEILAKSFSRR